MPLTKRHEFLWGSLARNFGAHTKTLATFSKRFENEGSAFLTQTLPSLHKTLLSSLEEGKWIQNPAFAASDSSCVYPAFMKEFFSKIFHTNGYVREYPTKIAETRQLLALFYKFEVSFTPSQVQEGTQSFIERDEAVMTKDFPSSISEVRSNFQSLLPDDPWDIRPRHGSGATADRMSQTHRRRFTRFIPSLHSVYAQDTYFFGVGGSDIKSDPVEPTARLTFVPKDSRGPRAICMEPHERMFIQQGLMQRLYDELEDFCPHSRGYINFTDQSINQQLAQSSSIDRSLATIDLKDASDMVSWPLIKALATDEWATCLQATRSAVVKTDNGEITLNKFAPMGSALCFPIEAMLFWSIAKTVCPEVWIYGDDIIIPLEFNDLVIEELQAFGLLVNRNKSYSRGFFRESCGGDYYKGTDVGYVDFKSYSLPRYVAFCNLIAARYGPKVGDDLIHLFEDFEGEVIYREPLSNADNPEECVYYTDFTSSSSVFFRQRYNEDLQRLEVRRLYSKALQPNTKKSRGPVMDLEARSVDEYFDTLTSIGSHSRPLYDRYFARIARPFPSLKEMVRKSKEYYECPLRSGSRDSKSRLKFAWGPVRASR